MVGVSLISRGGRLRPFYKSVFEGVDGFLVTVNLQLYFKSDVILPPFTSRITKYIIYSDDCFKNIKQLYESRRKFRPVTLSTIHTLSGKPLFKRDEGERPPLRAREGMVMTTRITYFTRREASLKDIVYDCNGKVNEPFDNIEFSIWEVEVQRLQGLTLGLDKGDIVKLEFKTPLIMSTKIMTPPPLRNSKALRRTPNEYRLLPTPGYIAASAMRVWLGIINDVDPDEYHAPYGIGRLADIFMPEIDYKIRPITILYGKDESGKMRKIRGVIGRVTYILRSRKIALTLDKLLALALKLGIGKNRSIGFGEITITTYK